MSVKEINRTSFRHDFLDKTLTGSCSTRHHDLIFLEGALSAIDTVHKGILKLRSDAEVKIGLSYLSGWDGEDDSERHYLVVDLLDEMVKTANERIKELQQSIEMTRRG